VTRIDDTSFEITLVAKSPIPLQTGGDYLDGRIYFVSGSHLCSFELPSK
jgi:hypothetical protein